MIASSTYTLKDGQLIVLSDHIQGVSMIKHHTPNQYCNYHRYSFKIQYANDNGYSVEYLEEKDTRSERDGFIKALQEYLENSKNIERKMAEMKQDIDDIKQMVSQKETTLTQGMEI